MHNVNTEAEASRASAKINMPPATANVTHLGNTMRRELNDAIRNASAAEAGAQSAKAASLRARALLEEARELVDRLEAEQDTARKRANATRATAVATAIRNEAPIPPMPAPREEDAAAIAAAIAERDSLEITDVKLGEESNAAAERAAAAAVQAEEIADSILDLEAQQIAAEIVAGYAVVRGLEDKLFGRTDRLSAVNRAELDLVCWRRRAAEAQDPMLKEEHRWVEHVEGIERRSRSAWLAYRRRLLDDAAARFDDDKERAS